MSHGYPEVEEQEGTRIEKILLAALVAFLLVGGFWALDRISNRLPEPVLRSYGGAVYDIAARESSETPIEDELGVTKLRTDAERLQQVSDNRAATLNNYLAAQGKAEETYKFRREEYRTAMEAGKVSPTQRAAFESARARFQAAGAPIAEAKAAAEDASKKLADAQAKLRAAEQRAQDVFESRTLQRNVRLFGFHFSFAAACVGISWLLWQTARRRRWRYHTILTAFFTASLLQLLFLIFRYCWALFLEDFAVLGVAALGTVICILAIIAIKRWLFSPERLAEARLSARRCTFCATPFIESQRHCWKCGNALIEPCPQCGQDRLRFAPHCGHCGAD